MAAKLIDGDALAGRINQEVVAGVNELAQSGRRPHLVAIQVGENPASKIYTNMQAKNCEAVGIEYELLNLPGRDHPGRPARQDRRAQRRLARSPG